MPTDQVPERTRSPMRRFAKFAIVVIIVLCAAWTAIWFYARNVVASRIDEVLAARSGGPADIFCADRQVAGFPFRMALSCSKAGVKEQARNLSVELDGFRVTALVYRPSHVLAELTAPLSVVWNAPDAPLKADWSSGRASVSMANQDLNRLSTEFDDFSLATALHAVTASHTEFHARPTDDDRQTDLAWSADNATLGIQAENSAPFSVDTTMRIDLPPAMLLAGGFDDRDIAVPDLNIRVNAGESRISASGAFTFSRTGTANGDIVIHTENIPALAAFMQTLPSAIRNQAQTAVGGVIAMSKPATNALGHQVSELTLTIRDNVIFAGTRQIGVLGEGR